MLQYALIIGCSFVDFYHYAVEVGTAKTIRNMVTFRDSGIKDYFFTIEQLTIHFVLKYSLR